MLLLKFRLFVKILIIYIIFITGTEASVLVRCPQGLNQGTEASASQRCRGGIK
jgi:hypothetical protein